MMNYLQSTIQLEPICGFGIQTDIAMQVITELLMEKGQLSASIQQATYEVFN